VAEESSKALAIAVSQGACFDSTLGPWEKGGYQFLGYASASRAL